MKNTLYHHGIKGQKWGVRRDRTSSGRQKRRKNLNNNSVQKGKDYVQRFLKDNGKVLFTTSVLLASSALGVGYIGTLTSAGMNLKLDSIRGDHEGK